MKRILSAARRAASSSGPAGREAGLKLTATLTIGRLFSEIRDTKVLVDADLDDAEWAASITEPRPAVAPKSLSAAAQLRARVGLAIVANELMTSLRSERAWNTSMISYAKCNLASGFTTATSKRALNELVQMGLISELESASKARARRFRIRGTLSKEQRLVVKGQAEMVDLFAGVEGVESLAATLLANVSHPAWNFGRSLGHRTWWVALTDAAGLDPVDLGVSKRNTATARKLMADAGLDTSLPAEQFLTALNAYATANGCTEAFQNAERRYREQASSRALEIKMHQGFKAEALVVIDKLIGDTSKIPALEIADGRKFSKWLAASTTTFSGRAYPTALLGHIQTLLARRIARRIGDSMAASVVAGWILAGAEAEDGLPAKRLAAMTAARGLNFVGAALSEIPAGDAAELEQKAWLKGLRDTLSAGKPMTAEMRDAVAADLRGRLLVCQYGVEKSNKASVWCLHNVPMIGNEAAAA